MIDSEASIFEALSIKHTQVILSLNKIQSLMPYLEFVARVKAMSMIQFVVICKLASICSDLQISICEHFQLVEDINCE